MNILSYLRREFGSTGLSVGGPEGLVCPRCEKALSEHDEEACARRMSRRYFFGIAAGAAVAVAAPELVLPAGSRLEVRIVGPKYEVNLWEWTKDILISELPGLYARGVQ
jgi:hypothetical protein